MSMILMNIENHRTLDIILPRRNFGFNKLTDVEVVHHLLSFNDDLSQAYRYYQ